MPTGKTAFDKSLRIEPWHLAQSLTDCLGYRPTELSAPTILAVDEPAQSAVPSAALLPDDFRNTDKLRLASRRGLSLSLLLLGLFAGCVQTPAVPLHEASLKVLLDGEPADGARVVLHPVDGTPRVWARGTANAAGVATLSAFRGHTGVPAGRYIATVVWHKHVISGEDYVPGPNVIPDFYGDVKQSPLRIEIQGEQVAPATLALSRCDCPGTIATIELLAEATTEF